MTDIAKHPLLKQAYDVCLAIEECGASIQLTNAVTKASALLMALDRFIQEPAKPEAERQVADFLKRPGEDLKDEQPRTLESYFAVLSERGWADSIARCTHHKDGAHFYIRPANVDGETLQFVVSGNTIRNA